MKKVLTDIRFYIAIIIISWVGLLANYLYIKDELNKCQTGKEFVQGSNIQEADTEQTIDSLQVELFHQQTIVGRYEVALEILKEKNKKAADEYEFILTTQTE